MSGSVCFIYEHDIIESEVKTMKKKKTLLYSGNKK